MNEICENYEAALELWEKIGPEKFEEVMEIICEAIWDHPKPYHPSVKITSKYRTDAINSISSGTVDVDGEKWEFQIENGDRRGTWILEFGKDGSVGKYEPPTPDPLCLIPSDPDIVPGHRMWNVYLAWRKDWIPELERKIAYDSYFQPGCKTDDHYRPQYESRGLKIGRESDLKYLKKQTYRGS